MDGLFEKYRGPAVRSAAILGAFAVAAIIALLLYPIRGVIMPFIYAGILVYLGRPIVNFLAARRVPRTLAVVIGYIILLLVIGTLLAFIIPTLVKQTMALVEQAAVPAQKFLADLQDRVPESVVEQTKETAGELAGAVASATPQALIDIFGGVAAFFLAWLVAFYILKDLDAIEKSFFRFIPPRYRDQTREGLRTMDEAIRGYLRGQALDAAIVGTLAIILLVILRVKFALLIGILTGVLNVIPYIGAIVGGALGALMGLTDSVQKAVLVVIGMLLIQQLEGAVIAPMVMRRAVQLHPATVLFALMTGGVLLGFFGLIISIPTAAAVKALLEKYYVENEKGDKQEAA